MAELELRQPRCHVLILIPTFGEVGGAERVVMRLSNGLDTGKYRVTVAGLKHGDGRVLDLLPPDSPVSAISLGARSKADVRVVLRLVRLLQRDRVDILYSFMFHAGFLGSLIGRLVRVPVILCSTRSVIDRDRAIRKLALRLTWRLADHFTAVSAAVRDYLVHDGSVDPRGISVVYNGIELDAFPFIEREWANPHRPIIGCVANLEAKKGYGDWLEAASIVSQDAPGAQFRIIGDGSERGWLSAAVRSRGLSDRVELLGYRTDIAAQMAEMHIYVQSSLYEGMPNAVIEAMATGLPVVATGVGGVAELVDDGVTGYVVPPGRPDLLARRVLHLLEDPHLAEKMGRVGRRVVETRFSLGQMVRQTDILFQRFLWEKLRLEYVQDAGWLQRFRGERLPTHGS